MVMTQLRIQGDFIIEQPELSSKEQIWMRKVSPYIKGIFQTAQMLYAS